MKKLFILFATTSIIFQGPTKAEAIQGKELRLKDQIGKEMTLKGEAKTDGFGPLIERTTGTTAPGPNERIIFILEPTPPQSFKSVAGNAPTLVAWPDDIEGKEIQVTGILDLRPSPKGYRRTGDGRFIKYKKKGPGEFVLKSAHWSLVF